MVIIAGVRQNVFAYRTRYRSGQLGSRRRMSRRVRGSSPASDIEIRKGREPGGKDYQVGVRRQKVRIFCKSITDVFPGRLGIERGTLASSIAGTLGRDDDESSTQEGQKKGHESCRSERSGAGRG